MEGWLEQIKRVWPTQLVKGSAANTRLLWMGLLGVIFLLLGGVFDWQTTKPKPQAEITQNVPATAVNRSYEEILEVKLSNLLSQVKGAGTVAVSVTLESGNIEDHEKNVVRETKTVQEKDTSGGVRTTTETKESQQVLMSKENGIDKPVMVREIKPEIKGVLIVAEGAYDSTVKANLISAVEAGLGIPAYKITVLPHRK